YYYKDLDTALFWWKMGYTIVPYMGVTYYNFYLTQFEKNKRIMLLLVPICILENLYLWISPDVRIGTYALANIGVVWDKTSSFTYALVFGMAKYIFLSILTGLSYFREYKQESLILRKKQLLSLSIIFLILVMGWTEWLPSFNVRLHIAWALVPIFILSLAYCIIRYRVMEIDTVIHKTLLWLSTVFLLVLPAALIEALLMSFLLKGLSVSQVVVVNTLLATVYLILFVAYYNRLRPRIDHFFRRRKYDYQTILGKVAEKIATTISIEDLSHQLLTEVCEAMYLRNAVLYVLTKDGKQYSIMGRRGYKEVNGIRQRTALEIFSDEERKCMSGSIREIDCATTLAQWFAAQQDVIEKEQVEFDPRYEKIKEDASACFRAHDVEVVVPLLVKGDVNALLGLGKKENLQAYTVKDIELLKKLGQEAGVTVFNALHYEQLAETERLEDEMKMGRQIQMALLPQKTPDVSRLNVQGLMHPAKEIGGDYYDFVSMPDKGKLAIVIGDVSGKGVAAGLLMSMVKATIHTLSQENVAPKRLLMRINHMLYQNIQAQKFMTLLYFVWQPQDQTLVYSSAGHEHILICRDRSTQIEEIQSGGFMLGMIADIDTYLEEREIKLQPRDKVLLYTDGVTEAENTSGDRFNLTRLKESFQKHSQKPAGELMQSIKDEVYGFIGSQPQYDDITLVVLEAE
ncbi:MAG: SpoIIE family protein phosphatase, partial [Candidatus Omnitrophica bacterium]|nr:SpoIIE family protein phosphatase [Candidatus Omnitrophota bacterium]